MNLGDQDKSWAPKKVCVQCLNDLHFWLKGKKTALRFGIPMTWRELKFPLRIVIFIPAMSVFLRPFIPTHNCKNQNLIPYPDNIQSAIPPVSHGPNVSEPMPPNELSVIPSESSGSDHPHLRLQYRIQAL
ncbi:uncharacterized protein NPIL_22971 [Nephila pilipes]|uniref:Uncharacterized protein n=1 Tax=Nephila pilipes TaxID=299642 RepID=A0A8X6P5V1_NEPPI|nr:uncharacterized protein NPIL_22971 [Nephila pilipes]